jgi:hypothetical protein
VAADGRLRLYREYSYSPAPVRKNCVVSATARRYGLCVQASRSLCFGPPEPAFRQEHDAACKISATYVACSWPDAVPRQVFLAGRRVYRLCGVEHEWLLSPQGHVAGRLPAEMTLTPQTEDLLQAGWAVCWQASVGAANSCDTYLVTEAGPREMTSTESWPLKKIYVQGANFFRPDLLER